MEKLVAMLRAAGEPTRLRIVLLLARGELTVSELVNILGQSQPRVSRHLRLLTDAGLAQRIPEGSNVYYRLITVNTSKKLSSLIARSVSEEDPVVRRDLLRLEEIKQSRRKAIQEFFDQVSNDWERIRSLQLSESEVEAEILEAAGAGPIGLLVDVGVGTGRILEILSDRVEQGIGIDINRMMLNIARINLEQAGILNCTVREADVTAIPIADASADLVTVHQVLHYLSNPEAAIRECSRILRSDGQLIIVDFAPHQMDDLRESFAHQRLGFSDDEMAEWIDAAGLVLKRQRNLVARESDGKLTVKLWLAGKA